MPKEKYSDRIYEFRIESSTKKGLDELAATMERDQTDLYRMIFRAVAKNKDNKEWVEFFLGKTQFLVV